MRDKKSEITEYYAEERERSFGHISYYTMFLGQSKQGDALSRNMFERGCLWVSDPADNVL